MKSAAVQVRHALAVSYQMVLFARDVNDTVCCGAKCLHSRPSVQRLIKHRRFHTLDFTHSVLICCCHTAVSASQVMLMQEVWHDVCPTVMVDSYPVDRTHKV